MIKAIEYFEKAIELTRNEESMINLCSMLAGAQTQFKILTKYSNAPNAMNFFNNFAQQ